MKFRARFYPSTPFIADHGQHLLTSHRAPFWTHFPTCSQGVAAFLGRVTEEFSTWETFWAGDPRQSPPLLRLSDVYMSVTLCRQAHTCVYKQHFFSLSLFCLLLQFACSHLCSIYVYQFISLAAALSMKCFYLVPSNSSWSYLPYESR